MKLINQDEFKILEKEVMIWINNTNSGKMYHDSKGIVKGAIMEFLLNKENKTLFTHLADKA